MIRRTGIALSAFGFLVGIPLMGWGAEPSFAELLTRAHAQANAGHQWAPPGDNVAETFMAMVNLLPQATPEQLADFEALLREQQKQIATSSLDTPDLASPDMKTPAAPPALAGVSGQPADGTGASRESPVGSPDAAADQTPLPEPAATAAAPAANKGETADTVQPAVRLEPVTTTAAAAPTATTNSSDHPNPGAGTADAVRPDTTSAPATKAAKAEPTSPTGSSAQPASGMGVADATQPTPKPDMVVTAPATRVSQPDQTGGRNGSDDSARPKPTVTTAAPPPAAPPPAVQGPDMPVSGTEKANVAQIAPKPAATVTQPSSGPIGRPDQPAGPAATASPASPPVTVAKATPLPEPGGQPALRVPTMAPMPSAQPPPPDRPTTATIPKQARASTPASRAFATTMFARGRTAEEQGDISGARRFYTVAAQNGLADAARALARLYDPTYVREKTFGGIEPDSQLSRHWRDRAAELDAQSSPSQPQALTER